MRSIDVRISLGVAAILGSRIVTKLQRQLESRPEFTWSRKYAECQNCGTTRRKHRRHGPCTQCAYANEHIGLARGWDRSKPATLKGISASGWRDADGKPTGLTTDNFDNEVFERFRRAYVEEFERRLRDLRNREQHRKGEGVDAITIEHQLRRLVIIEQGVLKNIDARKARSKDVVDYEKGETIRRLL
jgi:hypothetical protein